MRSIESRHKKTISEERPLFMEGKLVGTQESIYEEVPDANRLLLEEVWKNSQGDPYTRVAYERDADGRIIKETWTNGPAENPEGDQREGTLEHIYDAEGNLKEKRFQG